MAKIHRQAHPNDFQDNELLNVVLQKLIAPPIVNVQGKIYYDSVKKIPFYSDGVEWIPFFGKPVQFRYASEAAMLAEQPIHNLGYLYYRSDEDIYYEYLGTTLGTMTDYNPIGGSGTSNNEVKVIYVNPDLLSGVGTIEEQICEYINDNIEIDYSKQYSKINIVLGIDPLIPIPQEIINGILYNGYVIEDPRKISSSDDWDVPRGNDSYNTLIFIEPMASNSSNTAGIKLKESGLVYWDSPNTGANNLLKFNGKGAGRRSDLGVFTAIRQFLEFWNPGGPFEASDEYSNCILSRNDQIFRTPRLGVGTFKSKKKFGKSIRLINKATTLENGEEGIYIGNDGKVYRTICIGNVEWLADNLAETKYRNGDDIPEVTDNATWAALTTGARCFYDNNEFNAYPI